MLYEKTRELKQLDIQEWLDNEIFSLGWFVIIGVVAAYYIVWLKLLDKSRAKELLLLGALGAVFFHINIMVLTEILGLAEYTIRLLPVQDSVFVTSTTLSPITIMLVQQYTSSWKRYLLWSAVGMAILNFVIFPAYMALGILRFHHNYNVFFHFIVTTAIAQFTRLIFLWISGTQKRHAHSQ